MAIANYTMNIAIPSNTPNTLTIIEDLKVIYKDGKLSPEQAIDSNVMSILIEHIFKETAVVLPYMLGDYKVFGSELIILEISRV